MNFERTDADNRDHTGISRRQRQSLMLGRWDLNADSSLPAPGGKRRLLAACRSELHVSHRYKGQAGAVGTSRSRRLRHL